MLPIICPLAAIQILNLKPLNLYTMNVKTLFAFGFALLAFCSCSVFAVTAGKSNSTIKTTSTTTTVIDSTIVSLNPNR